MIILQGVFNNDICKYLTMIYLFGSNGLTNGRLYL